MFYCLYPYMKPTMRSPSPIKRTFAYTNIFNYSVFDLKFHLQLLDRLFLLIFLLLRLRIMPISPFSLFCILSLYLQTVKVQHRQLAEYNPSCYPLTNSFYQLPAKRLCLDLLSTREIVLMKLQKNLAYFPLPFL